MRPAGLVLKLDRPKYLPPSLKNIKFSWVQEVLWNKYSEADSHLSGFFGYKQKKYNLN